MLETLFHPLVGQWFRDRFGEPTHPQRLGWPSIASGSHTLVAAPTGSGKTLAAFLVTLDRLIRQGLHEPLPARVDTVYVSPLRALSSDIERNLQQPLAELRARFRQAGCEWPDLRVGLRTGDTTSAQRQAQLRRPPQLLVTTPESLYLLVTSESGRRALSGVRTVIVDEIHALAQSKRGAHLALTLERLQALQPVAPVRIGLSATQKPMEQIAQFLVGYDGNRPRPCQIVDAGHLRELDLSIEVPDLKLEAVCRKEHWQEIHARLAAEIRQHRSTLIFVNTRRLAERLAHFLRAQLGSEAVAAHHGSVAKERRLAIEGQLKAGEVRAIVATSSLEMGIDIGAIDLVCQIGSVRSISTFLQRVGRSGHGVGRVPKGRLFPLTAEDLVEAAALVRAVRRGELDRIEIPRQPLDLLGQQLVAEVAARGEWECDAAYDVLRQAMPYRELSHDQWHAVLEVLSRGCDPHTRQGALLHWDRVQERLTPRRSARLSATLGGGAIPENNELRVVLEDDATVVGTVHEDFAFETQIGNVFLLGNSAWRVVHVRGGEMVVADAHGAPPNVPFWFGEAPARSEELSRELATLRQDWVRAWQDDRAASEGSTAADVLRAELGLPDAAWQQLGRYLREQHQALPQLPAGDRFVCERFLDQNGGWQVVIHAPLGTRINRAWGMALRRSLEDEWGEDVQAVANDNGLLISVPPHRDLDPDTLPQRIAPSAAETWVEQAVLGAPVFRARWRWTVTRALAVARIRGGKRVPPHLQRFRSDDLLASVFPDLQRWQQGELPGMTLPRHPWLQQTLRDCLEEWCDVPGWRRWLERLQAGEVAWVSVETREPSPFAQALLNASPYAFLDDAPMEERRTRAVMLPRFDAAAIDEGSAALDPEAVREVVAQAWPLVRDADELHDALDQLLAVPVDELQPWADWIPELEADERLGWCQVGSRRFAWATEQVAVVRGLFPEADWNGTQWYRTQWHGTQPTSLDSGGLAGPGATEVEETAVDGAAVDGAAARSSWVAARLQAKGPVTCSQLEATTGWPSESIQAALERLESEGRAVRGHFVAPGEANESTSRTARPQPTQSAEIQWCDRRLLVRMNHQTLARLRQRIQAVEPGVYWQFLLEWQGLATESSSPQRLVQVLEQLQGQQIAAGAWEPAVLARRGLFDVGTQLDGLIQNGEWVWGACRWRDEPRRSGSAVLTRATPVGFLKRDELSYFWQIDGTHDEVLESKPGAWSESLRLRAAAAEIDEQLARGGAMFSRDLEATTSLLPTQIEEGLRELAAAGRITADSFASLRALFRKPPARGRRGATSRLGRTSGRWSRFPPPFRPAAPESVARFWCDLLLRRWGIVFRDLLQREPLAPPWYRLVRIFREMEWRGEVRGGRFVLGVGGEQFGTASAIERLRAMREQMEDPAAELPWVVLAGCDPLNLTAVLDAGPRVAATHTQGLVLERGRVVATCQGEEIEFRDAVGQDRAREMTQRWLTLHWEMTR